MHRLQPGASWARSPHDGYGCGGPALEQAARHRHGPSCLCSLLRQRLPWGTARSSIARHSLLDSPARPHATQPRCQGPRGTVTAVPREPAPACHRAPEPHQAVSHSNTLAGAVDSRRVPHARATRGCKRKPWKGPEPLADVLPPRPLKVCSSPEKAAPGGRTTGSSRPLGCPGFTAGSDALRPSPLRMLILQPAGATPRALGNQPAPLQHHGRSPAGASATAWGAGSETRTRRTPPAQPWHDPLRPRDPGPAPRDSQPRQGLVVLEEQLRQHVQLVPIQPPAEEERDGYDTTRRSAGRGRRARPQPCPCRRAGAARGPCRPAARPCGTDLCRTSRGTEPDLALQAPQRGREEDCIGLVSLSSESSSLSTDSPHLPVPAVLPGAGAVQWGRLRQHQRLGGTKRPPDTWSSRRGNVSSRPHVAAGTANAQSGAQCRMKQWPLSKGEQRGAGGQAPGAVWGLSPACMGASVLAAAFPKDPPPRGTPTTRLGRAAARPAPPASTRLRAARRHFT